MRSPLIKLVIAVAAVLAASAQAMAEPTCRPTLAFTEAHYSAMQLPKLERTWTVAFAVDSSRCATSSGAFSVVFTVWTENGPDFGVDQTFEWNPDINVISKLFWADESVGGYRVDVDPCPCRN